MERKLVTIVHADVACYSRLIGLDEEGTIARLRTYRRTLIDPSVTRHGGRIVKSMGTSTERCLPRCCRSDAGTFGERRQTRSIALRACPNGFKYPCQHLHPRVSLRHSHGLHPWEV
jgi:class 3 adenylate cyclase